MNAAPIATGTRPLQVWDSFPSLDGYWEAATWYSYNNPEPRDYGGGWTRGVNGYRVLYIHGTRDVIVVSGDYMVTVLAVNMDADVVEMLLSRGGKVKAAWRERSDAGENPTWVSMRLKRWQECEVVTYTTRAGTSTFDALKNLQAKAVTVHCQMRHNFAEANGGGWYRRQTGDAICQGRDAYVRLFGDDFLQLPMVPGTRTLRMIVASETGKLQRPLGAHWGDA